ncbi:phosphate ABC transporter substrate-binding protein [Paludifilum halophilum]|uniref:Phosphate-binding protein n=2 Tax=Paludifilum halophilum TaxID=1642702 RepID=A0A235B8L7_9BACL|nr:phosphate ABC transporter substrate-binding protein [Paludifilum halophilum]
MKSLKATGAVVLSLSLIVGCSSNANQSGGNDGGDDLSGNIKIDGSSTVYPITQAVAEEFMKENPGVQVTVSTSGTGGGFEKWTQGETDINDASRPIKDEEKEEAEKNGIEPVEIPVAYDALTVVVNKENDFVDKMTIEQLKKLWEPDSKVETWKDINPEWPDEPVKLYGPGTSSGTFDYFTETVLETDGKSRTDYTASEDDNTLVQGVAGDKNSLGYFGFSYYLENKDKLKPVKIVNDEGKAVEPSIENVNNGSYNPLSRPIFIYASPKVMERPEVQAFIDFYLKTGNELVEEVGYVKLPEDQLKESKEIVKEATKE